MKKKIFMIFITLISILCVACSKTSDKEIAADTIDSLINAMELKDGDTLTGMFSNEAINADENFKEDLEKLFDYFQGNFVSRSSQGNINAFDEVENDERKRILYFSYDIKTTTETYRVAVCQIVKDTSNKDNVGIHSMYIIKLKDDVDANVVYRGDDKNTPGINIDIKNKLPEENWILWI